MSVKPIPSKPNHREYRTGNDDGSAVRVTLGDGRVALVGKDWRDLPLDFHNKAIRSGCEARRKGDAGDSTVGHSATAEADPSQGTAPPRVGTDAAVRAAMVAAINDDPEGLFNETTGAPDPVVIAKYAGFGISKEQFSKVWKALHEELKAAQEAEDEAEETRVRQEGASIAASNAAAAAAAESAAAAAAGGGDASKLDPEPGGDGVSVDLNALDKRRAARKKVISKKVARTERAKKPAKPAAAK